MQNIKTYIVVGVVGTNKEDAEFTVLHLGPYRPDAREVYLANKSNLDFDFVGMHAMAGFTSRARPKVDAEHERARAESLAKEQVEEVLAASKKAEAVKDALAEAALKADAEVVAAQAKLDELLRKSGVEVVNDDETDEGEGGEVVNDDETEAPVSAPKSGKRASKAKADKGADDDGDDDKGEDADASALLK